MRLWFRARLLSSRRGLTFFTGNGFFAVVRKIFAICMSFALVFAVGRFDLGTASAVTGDDSFVAKWFITVRWSTLGRLDFFRGRALVGAAIHVCAESDQN
jgi:hypothetical protein